MLQPPTGIVTFLFTDIEGSTRLWEQHPNEMRLSLARHDDILRRSIEDNGGFVFKTVGDAFCAVFSTPLEALQAALSSQLFLAAEAWDVPVGVRVRMALHTGIAEERGGDYFGPPLNRVARLMAAAHGGQTLLSGATHEFVQGALPSPTTLIDLGNRRLKDLGRPEHVFQMAHPALPSDFPPLRTLDNPELPNNLPQQTSSFVGREKESAEVKSLLQKCRLLTLVGGGGAGKTRLSLSVAADLLDRHFDGVWLVELAALTDPALVGQAVADELGVQEKAGQPISKTLIEWLKPKRLLLILDNCEHLIAACADLAARLLKGCPDVHLLATSREPLNVPGEQTYRISSLSLPDLTQVPTGSSLSRFESIRLFVDRAQAVQPSFRITDANAAAAAQVCRRLDGIPLALELAAARIRVLTVEEVNARLDDGFRLLTGGRRTALPRQQTLRALIDWSYDLLTENEKTLLCRLSVFAGGWTLAAAEAVCSGQALDADQNATEPEIEESELVDLLTGLVDKSLVVYEEGAGDGDRYRFLETVRQYATDRLAERGEAESMREQAAAWFLGMAEEANSLLAGPVQTAWLQRLETEHDNLRASLSWYEHRSEQTQGNGSVTKSKSRVRDGGLRLVAALGRFWAVRGHYAEGRQWSAKVLERTQGQEEDEETDTLIVRARALFGAGYLAYNQGDFAETRVLYEQSLTIFRSLGHEGSAASMLDNLGNVAYEQGDYTKAQALYEESLMLQRQLGNERGVASSLGNLGNVAHAQSNYEAAWVLHQECLTIQRQGGDQRGIANSLNNMGNVAYDQGDYAVARALHEESLALQRQLGNQRGIANSLQALGSIASKQGDYSAAWALHRDSLEIRRSLGDQRGIVYSLEGMAGVACGRNHPSRAVHLCAAAASLRRTIGSPPSSSEQQEMDNVLAFAGEALGKEAVATAWDWGQAMNLEQALEYALSNV